MAHQIQDTEPQNEREGWKKKVQIAIDTMKHYSPNKPFIGQLVKWKEYDVVLVKEIKIKDQIAKVCPVYFDGCSTLPYKYHWVDFSEIGF